MSIRQNAAGIEARLMAVHLVHRSPKNHNTLISKNIPRTEALKRATLPDQPLHCPVSLIQRNALIGSRVERSQIRFALKE